MPPTTRRSTRAKKEEETPVEETSEVKESTTDNNEPSEDSEQPSEENTESVSENVKDDDEEKPSEETTGDERIVADSGLPNEAVRASQGQLADGSVPGEVNLSQFGDDDDTIGKDQDPDAYAAKKVLPNYVEPDPSDSPDRFAKDVQSKAETAATVRSVVVDVPQDKRIQNNADDHSARRGEGGQTYRAYIQSLNGGLVTAQYDTTENGGARSDLRNVSYSMQLEDLARDVATGDADEKDIDRLVGDNETVRSVFDERVEENKSE